MTCQQTPKPKFIDGRLDEWSEPFLTIDGWFWRPETKVQPSYGGAFDLSSTARFAWDAEYLYLAFSVLDDCFSPANEGDIFAGDAILFAVAPAEVTPNTPVVPVEFAVTYDNIAVLYVQAADGKYMPVESAKVGISRTILPLPVTPMPREAGKTPPERITKLFYEIALPWALLPDIHPGDGAKFGMAIQLLDNDGAALRGSLKWRGGRSETLTKSGYGQVMFSAEKR